jgi:hypothetical protein
MLPQRRPGKHRGHHRRNQGLPLQTDALNPVYIKGWICQIEVFVFDNYASEGAYRIGLATR